MVIMAGMLPGVECARRRRLRQGGSSFCLYAGGLDHAHLGSSGSKERGSVCKEMTPAWALDSNAREAKERLDQKLGIQRGSVATRNQSSGTLRPPTAKTHATSSGNHSAAAPEDGTASTTLCVLQREVCTRNGARAGGRRRFSWSRLGRFRPAPAEAEASECAVCLEELRAGDVLVHLPCAHRFHWSCAVPWIQAASRCPVCRAHVHLASPN